MEFFAVTKSSSVTTQFDYYEVLKDSDKSSVGQASGLALRSVFVPPRLKSTKRKRRFMENRLFA